jgi:hypothetical protein
MPAPTQYPDWATDGLNTLEPPAGKVAAGWVPGEQPPSGWFNWWKHLVGEWTRWLDAEVVSLTGRVDVLEPAVDALEADMAAAEATLANAALVNAANVFTLGQTMPGLTVTDDASVTDLLTTGRLRVTGAGVSVDIDHDANVNENLVVGDDLTVGGTVDVVSTITSGGTIHGRDLRADDDCIVVNEYQYDVPWARSTIIPISSASGVHGAVVQKINGGGIEFTGAAQVVSFPIKLPHGAVLNTVQVLYEKVSLATASFWGYRHHSMNWTTPTAPTFQVRATVTTSTNGLQVVLLDFTGLTVDGAEDYEIVISSGAAVEKIHAVRVNWIDPGPRNH